MMTAKAQGKNRIVLYDDESTRAARRAGEARATSARSRT